MKNTSGIDYDKVFASLINKNKGYEFEKVQNSFKKVAFDRYKHVINDSLWEVREEDGKKMIYALHSNEDDLKIDYSVLPKWTATASSDGENITLAYKNVPIKTFSHVETGYKKEDATDFALFLEKQANSKKEFVDKVIAQLDPVYKETLGKLIAGEK